MSRVILLNRRYCPGEAWTNRILAYAKGFAEAGEEVVLYYIITDKKRTKPEIHIDGVKVVNIWEKDGLIARKIRSVSFIKNLLRFPKMVKKGDVFFVYGGYEYQLRMALKVKAKAKVFCEITEHPQIFGSSKSARRQNDRKLRMLKQLDGLFVISNSLKQYYVKRGIPEDTVHVINMFVDTSRFRGLEKTTKEKYIGYCGAVSYEKDGVDALIKAFAIFHKSHPDYQLKIIGKGVSEDVIPRLKNLTESLGVNEAVVFTGPVQPAQMPQLLYDASILALARPDSLQAQNGFPTKLGEYLATGNPVVVTSVGEIPDFLKSGENAFLAKPGDSGDFARQLNWVADNYEESKRIGLRGKVLSESEFNYCVQSQKALSYIAKKYKYLRASSFAAWVKKYRGNFKGLLTIVCYRIAHAFTCNKVLYILSSPVWLLYRFVFRWIMGIDIPERTTIRKGCQICHGVGLVVHPGTVMGYDVKLHQNTTIGSAVSGGRPPKIGNNVVIGANCVILGDITIGDNSIIGAGSVVIKDVPPYSIVVGNPGKVIKTLDGQDI